MIQEELGKVNWRAALAGFGVDFAFSALIGAVVVSVMLALKGEALDSESTLPSDVALVYQFVGVLGAAVGGVVAGFLARRRGSHIQMKRVSESGEHCLTVPAHKSIAKGTLNDILTQVSLSTGLPKQDLVSRL